MFVDVILFQTRGNWRWMLGIAGSLMYQLCTVVAFSHSHGILHRDLKPHNLLIITSGNQSQFQLLYRIWIKMSLISFRFVIFVIWRRLIQFT
ncbi:hypothetical protein M8C21_012154 [Ambrosia artemisiifolia]|uniref:Protein kinase domain-containing protein n=1 Tax=Ambrosia artemisiifolia TaxID=4212 RepID=A0AAD5D0A8_AMBAR|nr:hypothetical protein M8C21_012154 [Ambrosia artemisiifolia]